MLTEELVPAVTLTVLSASRCEKQLWHSAFIAWRGWLWLFSCLAMCRHCWKQTGSLHAVSWTEEMGA